MHIPLNKLLPLGVSLFIAVMFFGCGHRNTGGFELREGDRVMFLGDTLMERAQDHGWIELMLTTRFADRNVTFRNFGWSADTPKGDSRLGRSLLQAGHEPEGEGWKLLVNQIEEARPTVVFLGYGMANSFDGEAGLARFRENYLRLLDVIERVSPGVRLVLLSPIRHEALGPPWPDPTAHNAELKLYSRAIGEIAALRHAAFVPLDHLSAARTTGSSEAKLTDNGIHLNDRGYRVAAEAIEDRLFDKPGAWRSSTRVELLRQAIIRKNEWFFYRSRPGNMAYIFGFRKREQGNNAAEIPKFDDLILAEEKRIAQLRSLEAADVPPVPLRTGNLISNPEPQAHPEFEVAEGFEVSLWAEDPLLDKPVQMNFDPRGRLWVACTPVYPQIEPGQVENDKIVILQDTTGGGRADKVTLFAENLLLPLGVEPGDGGVYVAQSTNLLHLRDTDGDGKADERRVVLSGFGTEDTHHNLHTLRWGPDGRLYLNQSVYTRTNTETPGGVVRLRAGGMFRFDPRDQSMDILYRGWVNAWGHQFDAYGQSFVSDGAGNLGISWGIRDATYQTLAPARRVLQSISPGTYPKFCGLEIIHSEHFPADWQGDIITGDFRANRVVRFKVRDQGAGYVTSPMPDLLRTSADTFRPVDMKLGPDGALYIADWSNRIIQHGEVDFRDPRRDKVHGRIWRVTARGRALSPAADLTQSDNRSLLDQLISPNGYYQEHARRVLVERGAERVLPDLASWIKAHGDDRALLQAMFLYEAFNRPHPALFETLLAAHDPDIRAATVRALPPQADATAPQLARLVSDENPRVRLEAVRALGRIPSVKSLDQALGVLDRPMDPFLDYALWQTVNELAGPWLDAVKGGDPTFAGRDAQLAFILNALKPEQTGEVLGRLLDKQAIPRDGAGPWIELIGSAGGPAELRRLFVQLTESRFDASAAVRALAALNEAARLRKIRPEGELGALESVLGSPEDRIRIGAVRLVGAWNLSGLREPLLEIANAPETSAAERSAVFASLREIGGKEVFESLGKLAKEGSSATIRNEAVVAMATIDLKAALPVAIAALQGAAAPEAPGLWRSILGINGAGDLLAIELPKARLSEETARTGLRPAREGNRNQALVQTLMQIAGFSLANVRLSSNELQAMAADALARGDAARGEQLYRRADLSCTACHSIGGAGGKVGPDLTSIGASAQPDYLVESILAPNAKIKEGYHSISITMKNQQVLSGIIVRENPAEVVLRNAADEEVSIPVQDIAERTGIGSLMPSGLADPLLPEERLDLFKFLSQLGKPGPYDAAKRDVARFWRLYQVVSKNAHLGAERITKGDFTLADWVPAFTLVDGTLPEESVAAATSEFDQSRGLFAATTFQSTTAGKIEFTLAGKVSDVWINGRPVGFDGKFTAEINAGVNVVVLRFPSQGRLSSLKLSAPEVIFLSE